MSNKFTYSGGERHVEHNPCINKLTHRIQSSDDLIDLILISEILKSKTELIIPYFPYARQDRVTAANTAFSLKAICKIINSLGWDQITTFDPHSDVTAALLDNVKTVTQVDILWQFPLNPEVVIAPDAGAVKKAQKVAERFNCPIAFATKERDVATGYLKMTGLSGEVKGKNCLIVDDICDGGRTFTELAKELKARGASRVELYITHGIFSQGLEVFDGLIDHIYTTNTFLSGKKETQQTKLTIKEVI